MEVNNNIGNLSKQDSTWFSSRLKSAFQSAMRIIPHVDNVNIGNNKTYTGQVHQRLVSNQVGSTERPVFQGVTIRSFTSSVTAFECPCSISDEAMSNVQFGRDILGRVGEDIGYEMGRRADKVFIGGMNAGYDTDNTMIAPNYLDVATISQARSRLGAKAARGEVICLINYDQFSNLLLDERFSSWFFNNTRPLANDYGEPANDYLMKYQGILFIKLADDTPLPMTSEGKRRLFMFTRDSCQFLSGIVEPYGENSPIVQFQVHRGGYDFNFRKRLGFVITQPEGVLAIECNDGLKAA